MQLPILPARLRLNPAEPQTDDEFYRYMKVCPSGNALQQDTSQIAQSLS